MGWIVNDEMDDKSEDFDFKKKAVELQEGFDEMKKDFEKMKLEFIKNEKKQFAKFKIEINMMKDEYKKCVDALKVETYARAKAETMSKVLKETLEARKDLDELEKTEEMEIDLTQDEDGMC